jgi:N-methylhydantoinase A/oxoprolinase/acetone carboxylase beta subunit
VKLTLGIDAGGTYTDAVVLDPAGGHVLCTAKAPTTPHDLSLGMAHAVSGLDRHSLRLVRLVAISTTLATNAIVEGQGGRVGLLLVGYDEEIVQQSGLAKRLPVEGVRYLAGGHDVKGEEAYPLDTRAARRAIQELRSGVDAFAVSGYFSVMNPAHEVQVRELIAELTHAPVVCGHELTSRLNSLRRVATAVLNARLLPVIQHLLCGVKRVLAEQGIDAPLMVVRGDGSLMSEGWARLRPVETILSGPAASAIGGQFLAGLDSAIVVDMGGTTTDIAVLEGGQPWTNPEGATVGGWQTSVRAADLRTIGCGGDSHIRVEHGRLRVGPRRAIPLCRLGAEWPDVVPELQAGVYAGAGEDAIQPTDFLTRVRSPEGIDLTLAEAAILEALERGPLSMARLGRRLGLHRIATERLEAIGVLRRAGLTPTDLLLASPRNRVSDSLLPGLSGNRAAARAGAQVVAGQLDLAPDELIDRALKLVVDRVAQEILDKLVSGEAGHSLFPAPKGWAFLLERALDPQEGREVGCRLHVRKPIVAIGAPVASFLPQVAERLHTPCVIPPHAEVGNAVGAAVASITHTVEILVQPHVLGSGTVSYLIHSPRGRETSTSFAGAVSRGEAVAVELAEEAAWAAGAESVAVKVERQEVILGKLSEMTLRATATGRPRMAD